MDGSPVVAPPYVAGPLRLAPFRALMLGPRYVGDPASARLYSRPRRAAAERVATWRQRGRLVVDTAPALYVHEYTAFGMTVRGLVGGLDVSRRARNLRERVIMPHESVHLAQADDLADRMDATTLNPAPILLLVEYGARLTAVVDSVQSQPPDRDFTDRAGQRHRVWAIRGELDLAEAESALAPHRALLADGHHRYAAYLRLQARHPGGSADQGLAMLVDQASTPLHLGPIHRILHGVSLGDLRAAAAALELPYVERTRRDALETLAHSAVLVATDARRWATLGLWVRRARPPSSSCMTAYSPRCPAARAGSPIATPSRRH